MTRSRRRRCPSPTPDDRGQTVQDFAVGIGIFILATAFLFAFVPTIITPFADSVGPESAQSERIAATIVHSLSADDPNHLDGGEFISEYASLEDDALHDRLALRTADGGVPIDRVNITVETLDSRLSDPVYVTHEPRNEPMTAGSNDDGRSEASTTRIVTVDGAAVTSCDPACKLVVRVW